MLFRYSVSYKNIISGSATSPTKTLSVTTFSPGQTKINHSLTTEETSVETTPYTSTADYTFSTDSTTLGSSDIFYSEQELSSTESTFTVKPTILKGKISIPVSIK